MCYRLHWLCSDMKNVFSELTEHNSPLANFSSIFVVWQPTDLLILMNIIHMFKCLVYQNFYVEWTRKSLGHRTLCGWIFGFQKINTFIFLHALYILSRACWWWYNKIKTGPCLLQPRASPPLLIIFCRYHTNCVEPWVFAVITHFTQSLH